MTQHSILIANRGEIAIRIARACTELGLLSVAVHAQDDQHSLHVRRATQAYALPGRGAAAYLDIAAIIDVARQAGCDAIHPGYGFLSESAEFAAACRSAGLIFIGPTPEVLGVLGDKVSARRVAADCGVAILSGTCGPTSREDVHAFFQTLPAGQGAMIKAVAGGGGRGMRAVGSVAEIDEAYARCRSEANAAFGYDEVFVEELIGDARHIEIQVIGDGTGAVTHLGERECSVQRRNQKIMEIAPSPTLSAQLRQDIAQAALTMAAQVKYLGLGTFEFLVDRQYENRYAFIEANPRLQVEHTITEAIYGIDLVQAQIRVCLGQTLAEQSLLQADLGEPRGYAIQLRVNMETMQPDGGSLPAGGTISAYEPPAGPGIRVDGYGYVGYRSSPSYDSLLAKIIVHAPSGPYGAAVARARRALQETRIEGVATNVGFLAALLEHPDVVSNDISTRWLESHIAGLLPQVAANAVDPFFAGQADAAGAKPGMTREVPGAVAVPAPMLGVVVSLDVAPGDTVRAGQQVAVLEAMKMEHVVLAGVDGVVVQVAAGKGEVLAPGEPLLFITQQEIAGAQESLAEEIDLDHIRPDLAESLALHAMTLDDARPDAIARRRKNGGRTARENIHDLLDADSFVEYGGLTMAAQRSRYAVDHLRKISPADGLVGGLGTVNAELFGAERAKTIVAAYDYTVLAGTQGSFNHKKQDRLYQLAFELRRPLVLFAEGGGGRPGDTDKALFKVASLDIPTFRAFAKLSGLVPLVGIVHGRCFAGNAALLGCCDVIISTRNANIGMGGPAMIEGGGLGVYTPEEVGPVEVQTRNGVIDVLVDDEAQAVAAGKKYLSYFQGCTPDWQCQDQRHLRRLVPENRLRAYDVRSVIHTLADDDSVLELREHFGLSMVTALIRIEGRPVGLIANNPGHLGGAIDADAADKAARFIQLCNAHKLPILSLCDTPGFMVGPEAEKTAQVRRVSRMFVNTARLDVPLFTVVLRKGYGLGAMAMAGGDFSATTFTIAWPTGEFGGMGLEGAVRLGFRKQLEAIADLDERQQEYGRLVAQMYEQGKALNMAAVLEIDDVIDPADTRRWVANGLQATSQAGERQARQGGHVETW